MAKNKKPNEKVPGENPEGEFHYNPGNMAGKKPAVPEDKPDSELPAKEKPAG